MFINSVPVSSISSAVWNAATRTLSANPEPVPAADAVANVYASDVIGNKTDAPVTAVGADKSLMGYVKGLVGFTDTEIAAIKAKTDNLPTNPGTSIKNIQSGTIVLNAVASNTATITACVILKSLLIPLGWRTDTSNALDGRHPTEIELTNTTTITATRGGTVNIITIRYMLIEWN